MLTDTGLARTYLELIVETLDIPPSLYGRAIKRHHSLGDWLCRDVSRLKQFNPRVSPQGSFRHGTVVRPLFEDAEYDLDNVTTLEMFKTAITQKELKQLYGLEMLDYAQAHGMLAPLGRLILVKEMQTIAAAFREASSRKSAAPRLAQPSGAHSLRDAIREVANGPILAPWALPSRQAPTPQLA